MYNPDQFREERPEVLRAFIAQHPLGALVAVTADGLTANHIPMLWKEREGTPGVLQGHLARANPLWKMTAPEGERSVVAAALAAEGASAADLNEVIRSPG